MIYGNLLTEMHVMGRPRPKARPRLGKGGRFYTPKDVDGWAGEIEEIAAGEARRPFSVFPYGGPVAIEMVFYFARPKSRKNSLMVTRPDGDNLEKAVLDALNEILVLDDSQVVRVLWEKQYAETDLTRIRVYEVFDSRLEADTWQTTSTQ